MISVISAIKGRPDITKKCFEKIWKLADDPYDIEHIIAVDCNDQPILHYIEHDYKRFVAQFAATNKIQIYKVCHCKKPELYPLRKMSRDYWNPIAKKCEGNIIFGLTNDCEILTNGYDTILNDAYVKYSKIYNHSYFQFIIDDDGVSDNPPRESTFCSWLICTKPVVDLIGGIMPSELSSESGDTYMYGVFNQTTIKSQIDLFDKIKTKHIDHYSGHTKRDFVSKFKPIPDAIRKDYDKCRQKMYDDNYYGLILDNAILKEALKSKNLIIKDEKHTSKI